MNDPGLANLDRIAKAAEEGKLTFNEQYFWQHRAEYPHLKVIVFEGAEKWKQGPIAAGELVLCPGCEVKGEHYHEKGADAAS